MASRYNPRSANGNFRRKARARFKARGDPCSICRGRLGPIRYDQPSDAAHPLSFVIDEIRPVSRWKEFGYSSPEAAAQDPANLAPAHWVCNAAKGDGRRKNSKKKDPLPQGNHEAEVVVSLIDGDW